MGCGLFVGIVDASDMVVYPIYLIVSSSSTDRCDERNVKRAWEEHERLLAKFNRCVDAGVMPSDELRRQLTDARHRYTSACFEYLPDWDVIDAMEKKYPIGEARDTSHLEFPVLRA